MVFKTGNILFNTAEYTAGPTAIQTNNCYNQIDINYDLIGTIDGKIDNDFHLQCPEKYKRTSPFYTNTTYIPQDLGFIEHAAHKED